MNTLTNLLNYVATDISPYTQHLQCLVSPTVRHPLIQFLPRSLFCRVSDVDLRAIVQYPITIKCHGLDPWNLDQDSGSYQHAETLLMSVSNSIPVHTEERHEIEQRSYLVTFESASGHPSQHTLTYRQKLAFMLALTFVPIDNKHWHIKSCDMANGADTQWHGAPPRFFPTCMFPFVSILHVHDHDIRSKHTVPGTMNLSISPYHRIDVLDWTILRRLRDLSWLSPIADVATLEFIRKKRLPESTPDIDVRIATLYVAVLVLSSFSADHPPSCHWSKYVKLIIYLLYTEVDVRNFSYVDVLLNGTQNDTILVHRIVHMIRAGGLPSDRVSKFAKVIASNWVEHDNIPSDKLISIQSEVVLELGTAQLVATSSGESSLDKKLFQLTPNDKVLRFSSPVPMEFIQARIREITGSPPVLSDIVVCDRTSKVQSWFAVAPDQLFKLRRLHALQHTDSVVAHIGLHLSYYGPTVRDFDLLVDAGRRMHPGLPFFRVQTLLETLQFAMDNGKSDVAEMRAVINWFHIKFDQNIYYTNSAAEYILQTQDQALEPSSPSAIFKLFVDNSFTLPTEDQAAISSLRFDLIAKRLYVKRDDGEFQLYERKGYWEGIAANFERCYQQKFIQVEVPADFKVTNPVLYGYLVACGIVGDELRSVAYHLLYGELHDSSVTIDQVPLATPITTVQPDQNGKTKAIHNPIILSLMKLHKQMYPDDAARLIHPADMYIKNSLYPLTEAEYFEMERQRNERIVQEHKQQIQQEPIYQAAPDDMETSEFPTLPTPYIRSGEYNSIADHSMIEEFEAHHVGEVIH